MVALSCNYQFTDYCITDYIWRFFGCYSFCVFNFLMNFLRKYKVIWIQCSVFILLGIFRKKDILIILSCILIVLPFLFPVIAIHYINTTEKVIHTIGFWIKNILFTLVFVLVVIPLRILIPKDKKYTYTSFIDTDSTVHKNNFEKMW